LEVPHDKGTRFAGVTRLSKELQVQEPDFITIEEACAIVGGSAKPISYATFYRGVKAGRLPAPEHPTPGTARVRRSKLIEALNGGER
jgi:hypothetical protein